MTKHELSFGDSEAWKGEREINTVPIEINKEKDGVVLSFNAENKDEAWILNGAIADVLGETEKEGKITIFMHEYQREEKYKIFPGLHSWKLVGPTEEEAKVLVNTIKRRAIEIKAGELVAA